MKNILVPVDLSAASTRVCAEACALAKLTHARLVLLHVVETTPIIINDLYAVNAAFAAEAAGAAEKNAARRLHALGRRCMRHGLEVRVVQSTDVAVPCILEKATALKASYLVIGSHGHGAVHDLFAGSTTHGVLRKARCPVLVVPIPATRTRGRR